MVTKVQRQDSIRVDACIKSQGELWVTLTKLFQNCFKLPIYDFPNPWLAKVIFIHSSLVIGGCNAHALMRPLTSLTSRVIAMASKAVVRKVSS